MSERPHHHPPTLPRPSTWRLLVAAAVVVAFLYWMYRTGEKEGEVSPPPQQSSLGLPSVAGAG